MPYGVGQHGTSASPPRMSDLRGKHMQLGWLQTFIAVYECGSFTKAAQRLGITQPAVTQQIRSLEKILGQELFDRTPQGADPTGEGQILASETKEAISDLNRTISRRLGTTLSDRPLRLGGPAALMSERVLPSLAQLTADGMDIDVSLDTSSNLLEELKASGVDMAISSIQPRCRGIDSTPLNDEDLVLVASREIADDLPPGILEVDGARALEKLPLVTNGESEPITRHYWQTVFDSLPPARPALRVSDMRAVKSAVVASVGIAVLPSFLCTEELSRNDLVTLMDPEIPPITTFYLATRSGTLADPSIAKFHDHLLTTAKAW
ncbi:LysR family transcriptional regulator [Streptomyces mirabilis]|uniref:LysR family transcriptional regulator n=1 Tax=Streptomyces mirabilis TaxID=68239 RepID=UPI0036EFEF46